VAMADIATQPGLGVLDRAVGVEANAERALAVLREFGLSEPDPGLRNAVAVALMDKTYLHEHQAAFPNVTKGLLEALFSLGMPFLRKLAAVDSYRRASFSGAGALSKEVAEVTFALESWAASREWLVENAALGGTFADTKAPPKVYERLLRQIVGVLCLARKEEVASRPLERLLSDVRHLQMTTVADAKTTLQEAIAPSTAEYSYEREGPDHETVFHATVTDTRGRRGTGLARNKKQAAQNAALDFLRRHIPQALSTRAPEPAPRPPLVAIPEPHPHVAAVRKLQELFGLPPSATPLLSQALIHPSWAYEHSFEMAKYHQQNNQVLAFVGREAAEYEDVLAAASRATADPPQEFAFRGLANDGYNSLFRRTGLVSGLLLGAGQASKVTMEMGATALQAMIGAVFIAKGFPDSLAACWPQAWAPMWQTIASPTPRPHDPTTLLQQAASAMRLQAEYEFCRSGPDHASRSQATLVLDSETLRIRTRVTGSPVAGKAQAKQEVSATVLRTLDLLAQPTLGRELAARADEAKLARFLLAHQAALLATSPVPLQRWAAARLFGLHLAGVPDQLIAWAGGADQLLDSRNTIEGTGARLEEAFRAVLEPVNTLRTHLARTLETLEHISAPEDLTREHLDQLVQLCGVYRCVGSEDPDIELPELADDWNLLYRGRLVAPAMPAARLTGRERAILDAAIAAVLLPGATATVEVTSTKPLCLRIATATGPAPHASAIAEICGIWSAVTNSTVLSR
jgi:dsRNA-specific ribonuclease